MSAAPVELVVSAACPAPEPVCPAAACADRLARLEADADALERAIAAFSPLEDILPRLHAMETQRDGLLLDAEAARAELSTLEAATCAGAAAQLLCAIRDLRVQDAPEAKRARALERQARRFFAASGVLPHDTARALSQTMMR